MFFDEQTEDVRYQQIMLAIAQKQQELLCFRFDWENRVPREWPPKGRWGKNKKVIAQYEAMKAQLQQLKERAAAHRRAKGYPQGIFWWSIPWDQMESKLMYDLYQAPDDNHWRFSRSLETHQQGDAEILFLNEEGHCSDFSTKYENRYEELSPYSAEEREQMVEEYNRKLDRREAFDALLMGNSPYHAVHIGKEFDSVDDYLLSTDRLLFRDYAEDAYSRSLYTARHTRAVTVQSNSIHYECLLRIGSIRTDAFGCVEGIAPVDYRLEEYRGKLPPEILHMYAQKDAAVALAAHIADHAQYRSVPTTLFEKNILDGASDYSEALRQAKMYTCLAGKLKFT